MDSRNQESDDRRGGSLFRSRSGHLSGYVPNGVRPSHWKPNSLSKVPAAFLRFELADRLIAFLLAMRLSSFSYPLTCVCSARSIQPFSRSFAIV
jgi:hypothetical protein